MASGSEGLFKEAYDLHYGNEDYQAAISLYRQVIADFPHSREAQYATMQMRNAKDSLAERGELAERAEAEPDLRDVVLTTAPSLEGYTLLETMGIVTSECAFGMNLFRDFFAAMSDVFGGRSAATQKVLRDARDTCLQELRKEARRVGGNAVIAVDLDYSEFSGKGKSMLFLIASGTAVKVEPVAKGDPSPTAEKAV